MADLHWPCASAELEGDGVDRADAWAGIHVAAPAPAEPKYSQRGPFPFFGHPSTVYDIR
jgi:hypothetical protein